MTRWLAALSLALSLAPRSAAAQSSYTWDYLCTLGSLQACVTMTLTLEYDPTPQAVNLDWGTVVNEGATRATLTATNLQGMEGVPATDAWLLAAFGVQGLTTTWTTDITTVPYQLYETYHGLVPAVPEMGYWETSLTVDRPADLVLNSLPWMGPGDWEAGAVREALLGGNPYSGHITFFQPNAWGGIFGCDLPGEDAGFAGFYGGCGTTLIGTMVLPGEWAFAETTQAYFSGRVPTDGSDIGPRVTCFEAECAQLAVPEPGSLLLLATGVSGVAYVRRRRA